MSRQHHQPEMFCQVCRHPAPGHEPNCPVLTGEPQGGNPVYAFQSQFKPLIEARRRIAELEGVRWFAFTSRELWIIHRALKERVLNLSGGHDVSELVRVDFLLQNLEE